MADLLILDDRALEGEPDLLVQPGDDVRAHADLSNHRVIAIAFPKFREGRGYSSARILRDAGFSGDLRAVGDVTLDQLVFLKRAGFSSIVPDKPIDPDAAREALERYQFVYQKGADERVPAWKLRHG